MTREELQARVEQNILEAMRHLWPAEGVTELRILRKSTKMAISGYYDDPQAFARDAAQWDGRPDVTGIYWPINAVKPECLKRAPNRLRAVTPKGEATSDNDILYRRYLPADIDPNRSGSPATHEEHCEAAALQGRIADSDYMRSLGFPRPVEMDSGNGAYLLYPINLPNDDANRDKSKEVVKRCLNALARRFDCPGAHIDTGVQNAARVMRVPGTLNQKGEATPERRYRRCLLVIVPGVTLWI